MVLALEGQVFGLLTVLYRSPEKSRNTKWLCRCVCGTEKIILGSSLTCNRTTSCGKCKKDLAGKTFKFLTVIKRDIYEEKSHTYRWLCLCECGTEISVLGNNLTTGRTTSCGCERFKQGKDHPSFKHGLSEHSNSRGLIRSPIYKVWQHMKDRCYNVNDKAYKNYGERGIRVCVEWLDPENGAGNFLHWAYSKYPNLDDLLKQKYVIDRIDVHGNYFPDNCRFISRQESAENKQNTIYIEYEGETIALSKAIKLYKKNTISNSTIYKRIKDGWEPKTALEQ